jgi:short subunit dehydrogenase-like uncharacterized protein
MGACALIYGCTGYTGRLIVEKAKALALEYDVILAGRDVNKVETLARTFGLPWRCARLDDPGALDELLTDVDVVLHAAGPFSATARPMLEACLRARTHYLDIAGELPVFQEVGGYDLLARERGIMLMPGVGFAIVATDCLSDYITSQMPNALRLRIGISMPKLLSRGSVRTMLGLVRERVYICRNSRLMALPVGRLQRSFDYGEGDRWSTCVNWPDVYTATGTTGIGSVEVYMEADFFARTVYQIGALFAMPLQQNVFQWLLNAYAGIWPEGPSHDPQSPGRQVIVAEAEDDWRQCASVRLKTADGYGFTALAAVEITGRVLAKQARVGLQTPSRVYGPDFVLAFDGTTREDFGRRLS